MTWKPESREEGNGCAVFCCVAVAKAQKQSKQDTLKPIKGVLARVVYGYKMRVLKVAPNCGPIFFCFYSKMLFTTVIVYW